MIKCIKSFFYKKEVEEEEEIFETFHVYGYEDACKIRKVIGKGFGAIANMNLLGGEGWEVTVNINRKPPSDE